MLFVLILMLMFSDIVLTTKRKKEIGAPNLTLNSMGQG